MDNPNPMVNIEDKQGMEDLGRSLYFMYKGAISEGASIVEASFVVSAFVQGMIEAGKEKPADE